MNLEITNKVYIVTGGASGIGAAVCRLIAAEGGIVVIADKSEPKSQALESEINSLGQQAWARGVELTNEDSCRRLMQAVAQKYNRIDGLVNNAGVNDAVGLETGAVLRFEQSLRLNLVHYYTMAHYALPHLKQSRGAIVNTGSKVSVTGQGGTSGYAASKGGVAALTREWAAELLPYGIRVNAVLPAEVDTPQYADWIKQQPDSEEKLKRITSHIPLDRRFTKPEEIADTIVFLLSARSSHTTGQLFFPDGGYTHLDRMLS